MVGSKDWFLQFQTYRIFLIYRMVDNEFAPVEQTVCREYYLGTLRLFRKRILQKRLELWKNFSRQDRKNNIDQPPYSTDLTLCDYFLFPKLQCRFLKAFFNRLM